MVVMATASGSTAMAATSAEHSYRRTFDLHHEAIMMTPTPLMLQGIRRGPMGVYNSVPVVYPMLHDRVVILCAQ